MFKTNFKILNFQALTVFSFFLTKFLVLLPFIFLLLLLVSTSHYDMVVVESQPRKKLPYQFSSLDFLVTK